MARYEDQLYIKTGAEATRSENGDFVPGSASDWTLTSDCREEPSSGGQIISGTDGEDRKVSSVIQLPADCPDLAPGTEIQVRNESGSVQISGTILRFKRYRKDCRIWV
jgi:hypothetical protein